MKKRHQRQKHSHTFLQSMVVLSMVCLQFEEDLLWPQYPKVKELGQVTYLLADVGLVLKVGQVECCLPYHLFYEFSVATWWKHFVCRCGWDASRFQLFKALADSHTL